MPEPDVDPLSWSANSDQFGLSKSTSSMARALNELVNKIVEDDLSQSMTEDALRSVLVLYILHNAD
jgi:hypothetical protein